MSIEDDLWLNHRRGEYRERLANARKKPVLDIAPTLTEPDSRAEEEAKAIASDQGLEEEAKLNHHHRSERFKASFSLAGLILFWGIFIALMIAGLFWLLHIVLLPEKFHWLSSSQTSKIETVFFGGVLTAFVTSYANRHMK